MKLDSTLFLRLVISGIAIAVLAFCIFALPPVIMQELKGDFDYLPFLVGLYIPAVPFLFALYQAFNLLTYIDQSRSFSDLSVKALKNIKYCALSISALFGAGMPYIFYLGDKDDAPGLVALGFVTIGASFVIATFGAVLQKLVQNGIDIKSENDLTV